MKVLVIAAHADDEILGAGGTLLKHKKNKDDIYVCIVTEPYEPEWNIDYIKSKVREQEKVDALLGVKERIFCKYPPVKLNTIPYYKLNKKISNVVEKISPDIIYTHSRQDTNQDHQIVYDAVMVATRPPINAKVLCFEILTSAEWAHSAFIANTYVDIREFIERKIELFNIYVSQIKKYPHPRSKEGIRIVAQKRGLDVGLEYAEAFQLVKEVK